MIRFPVRFHASQTPDEAHVCEEPNYRETRRASKEIHDHGAEHRGRRREHFDFTALAAVFH